MKTDGISTRTATRARRAFVIGAAIVLAASNVSAQPAQRPRSSRRTAATSQTGCVPGAQVACACPRGTQGVQVCQAHGGAYGACDCSEGDSPAVDAPPRTGTAASAPSEITWGGLPRHFAPAPRRWYGWQTLIVDGASVGISALGLGLYGSSNSSGAGAATLIVAGVTQLIGPPIVHWAHGNVGRGFASLGFRLLLPTVGALIGFALGAPHSNNDQAVATVVGSALGSATAITLDAAWLAREPEFP